MTNPNPNQTSFKLGNTVSADGRRWHQAIKVAALKKSGRNKVTMLEKAADALVQLAVDGDLGALRELGNRLDGMAHQSVAVQTNAPSLAVSISFALPQVEYADCIEQSPGIVVDQVQPVLQSVQVGGGSHLPTGEDSGGG